jgi:hypothetical protein
LINVYIILFTFIFKNAKEMEWLCTFPSYLKNCRKMKIKD